MSQKIIRFGLIGCGLMGREFASACARWCHLTDVDFAPRIVAACDSNPAAIEWFKNKVPTLNQATSDYRELLANKDVDAVYCAVPHNLHADLYCEIIKSGKHLMGEKPFGIDKPACARILDAMKSNPKVFVRCSSEMPFYPGGYLIGKLVADDKFGRIMEVESGLWHSSDLNPLKPINWKRQNQFCGEYGCLGDLGMHGLHLPLRLGWKPTHVSASLLKILDSRPDGKGGQVSCGTWDNGTLQCRVRHQQGYDFQMHISAKRIAPGNTNTWFIRIYGTKMSAEYSTKNPKEVRIMHYEPGGPQAWEVKDVGWDSAYKGITGEIFEFGFSDTMLMMWAAFCDELTNGRSGMKQRLYCATPEEAWTQHEIFTAALQSHRESSTVAI
jgi:predicted dehydrogenase